MVVVRLVGVGSVWPGMEVIEVGSVGCTDVGRWMSGDLGNENNAHYCPSVRLSLVMPDAIMRKTDSCDSLLPYPPFISTSISPVSLQTRTKSPTKFFR